MTVSDVLKELFVKWNNQSYKNKCNDIGQIVSFGLFLGVIFFTIGNGYLDFIKDIYDEQLTFDKSFYDSLDDGEKKKWMILLLGFGFGVTILPLIIWHYVSQFMGMGLMYLIWLVTEKKLDKNE